MSPHKKALQEEEKRIRQLRRLMDLTAALLWQADLSLSEAQKVISDARDAALRLFPDKGETFDLIYGSRLGRILSERYRLQ